MSASAKEIHLIEPGPAFYLRTDSAIVVQVVDYKARRKKPDIGHQKVLLVTKKVLLMTKSAAGGKKVLLVTKKVLLVTKSAAGDLASVKSKWRGSVSRAF